MKLPAYPRTKPSGVEWLGGVPEHWSFLRLREGVKLVNGYPFEAEQFARGEGVPLVRIRDIFGTSTEVTWAGEWIKAAAISNDDILVGMDGDFNVAWWRGGDAQLNQRVCCLRAKQGRLDQRFLFYFVPFPLKQLNDITYSTTVKHLSSFDVLKFRLFAPPVAEQRAIAAFLDRETGRVDRLVAKKRELIERLKEKRTALISRTVTRGLPPGVGKKYPQITQIYADELKRLKSSSENLRQSASICGSLPEDPPLKPSALDWLGDIPKHWDVCKLKRVTISRCDGPFGSGLKSEHYCDNGVRVIRLQNIRFAQFDDRDAAFIDPEYYKELGDHSVVPGDLLIAGLGDESHPVGRACVAPSNLGPAMVKADCFRFRLNPKQATSSYVALQLSTTANALAGALATGTTRGRMNLSATEDREIALPPLPEQAAIAAYLDEETAKLDALVGKVEEAVERLQEYRTALITAAVTGKIDVSKTCDDSGSHA